MEKIVLKGVVGSTAYGLNREGSDIDKLGVFVAPTREILSLHPPQQTVVQTKPDLTMHEVGKFVALALKCNPTILELLFLDQYEERSIWGNLLIEKRAHFLSERYVRAAYGGYALQQANKLLNRKDDPRSKKHARHCFRLLRQGRELLATGQLTVKVPDPEFYWAFDTASMEEIHALFLTEDALLRGMSSILPEEPDSAVINEVLLTIRGDNW